MRTHMEIMAEKSYEDTRIPLFMVPKEKSCAAGELIWVNQKTTISWECMSTHMKFIHEKSNEDMQIPLLILPNDKS